jgi:hypothetical protein
VSLELAVQFGDLRQRFRRAANFSVAVRIVDMDEDYIRLCVVHREGSDSFLFEGKPTCAVPSGLVLTASDCRQRHDRERS